MRTKIISTLLFSAILFCCRKDVSSSSSPCDPCLPNSDPGEDTLLIQNFIFNVGTYWVFQDSANNNSDSVCSSGKVTGHSQITSGSSQCPCTHTFRYVMNNNSNTAGCYNYCVHANALYQYGVVHEFLASGYNGHPNTSSTVSFIGNYTLGSLSFDSVYKCKLYPLVSATTSDPDSGYVYLRARVGLIREVIYRTGVKSVYNLLRYHIQ